MYNSQSKWNWTEVVQLNRNELECKSWLTNVSSCTVFRLFKCKCFPMSILVVIYDSINHVGWANLVTADVFSVSSLTSSQSNKQGEGPSIARDDTWICTRKGGDTLITHTQWESGGYKSGWFGELKVPPASVSTPPHSVKADKKLIHIEKKVENGEIEITRNVCIWWWMLYMLTYSHAWALKSLNT